MDRKDSTRLRLTNEELDLHRLTVDEAIPKLDKFIHDAYRSGLQQVWIVHGKGTGTLRRAVRHHLSGHPLVAFCATADRFHGGTGVTQVRLSDW